MVACALALALGLTLLHLLYNYSRLKSIPGPFLAGFTDLWRAHARNSTGYGRSLAELHQRYGSIVRLGPNAVSISDIEDIAGVYRAVSAEELSWRRPNPSPDGDVVFQGEGAIDESLRSIVAAIRRHGTRDLASSLCLFAEDFVSDVLGSQRAPRTNSMTRTLSSGRAQANVFPCNATEELLLRGPGSLLKRKRFSCYRPGHAHLPQTTELYLVASTSNSIGSCHELPTLAAVIDSMTTTFSSVFTFLFRQPVVLRRLLLQIDSMPWLQHSSHLPHWRDIAGLTYLDAVMKETMRHTLLQNDQEIRLPTASLGVRHLRVLSDTTMSWHPHVVLCSRSVYGDDALTFRPERWLVEDPRHRKLMNDSLLPFQAYCESHPEVELVWLELKKAVVVLLREFDVSFSRRLCIFLSDDTISNCLLSSYGQGRTRTQRTNVKLR